MVFFYLLLAKHHGPALQTSCIQLNPAEVILQHGVSLKDIITNVRLSTADKGMNP